MGAYSRTIEITIEVEVDFDYIPGTPGCMYLQNGDPGIPPEPEEWDICEVNVISNHDESGRKRDPVKVDIGDYISSAEFDEIEQQLNDMGMEEDCRE